MTWNDILSEEPFEGQHWEGVYGLPPGSTVEGWEVHSGGSSPSLSPLDDSDDLDDSLSILDSEESSRVTDFSMPMIQRTAPVPDYEGAYGHRGELEDLQAKQYWRSDWRMDICLTRPFDIGDASTLGGQEH